MEDVDRLRTVLRPVFALIEDEDDNVLLTATTVPMILNALVGVSAKEIGVAEERNFGR